MGGEHGFVGWSVAAQERCFSPCFSENTPGSTLLLPGAPAAMRRLCLQIETLSRAAALHLQGAAGLEPPRSPASPA